MSYDITHEGTVLREKLVDEAQYSTGSTDRQLDVWKRLWVLDQYLEGKTAPMIGPVMGPVFRKLVKEGFISEEV